jgi:uncharacterized protein (DUF488 family)
MEKRREIWTIGHSTRSIEDFIALLKENKIRALADVRQFPGSRRYPQFGRQPLSESLAHADIEYFHFSELGGRRRARLDSPNTAWRNDAFRGYADYMLTAEFRNGIERLLKIASRKLTAIMCAEALWWRCHRGLISDFLKAEGWTVIHILGAKKTQPHSFTSAARIVDGKLSYEASASETQFTF